MSANRAEVPSYSADYWLGEFGRRLAAARQGRKLTQAHLAEEAGVSLATVRRLEAGHSVQLANWLRVLGALGLGAGLDQLIRPSAGDPHVELERARRLAKGRRRRASAPRRKGATPRGEWIWGEDA